jgi:hypothetical protein
MAQEPSQVVSKVSSGVSTAALAGATFGMIVMVSGFAFGFWQAVLVALAGVVGGYLGRFYVGD